MLWGLTLAKRTTCNHTLIIQKIMQWDHPSKANSSWLGWINHTQLRGKLLFLCLIFISMCYALPWRIWGVWKITKWHAASDDKGLTKGTLAAINQPLLSRRQVQVEDSKKHPLWRAPGSKWLSCPLSAETKVQNAPILLGCQLEPFCGKMKRYWNWQWVSTRDQTPFPGNA